MPTSRRQIDFFPLLPHEIRFEACINQSKQFFFFFFKSRSITLIPALYMKIYMVLYCLGLYQSTFAQFIFKMIIHIKKHNKNNGKWVSPGLLFPTSRCATEASTNESWGYCWLMYDRFVNTLQGYLGKWSLECPLATNSDRLIHYEQIASWVDALYLFRLNLSVNSSRFKTS